MPADLGLRAARLGQVGGNRREVADNTGGVTYYLYDGLGSTTGLTDGGGAADGVAGALEFRQGVVPPSRMELPFPA